MNLIKPFLFYPKDVIETKAHNILLKMEADGFQTRWSFEATDVADALELRIDWYSIPPDNKGEIVAKIEPLERRITLNESLLALKEKRGFRESTIAHEIGHWVLHINQDEADGITKQLELNLSIKTAERLFLCRKSDDRILRQRINNQLDKMEWQAQYFAGCLLMPRFKLDKARKGRNLTKWPHLYAMCDELGVTISNLTHRLQDLGWIYIPKNSKQIYKGQG
ncbi:MAG: ImmA/IrrE family metallo-endopeptidase [Microcystaceae cyanobacterium]